MTSEEGRGGGATKRAKRGRRRESLGERGVLICVSLTDRSEEDTIAVFGVSDWTHTNLG